MKFLSALLTLCFVVPLNALELPAIFSNHMVLQRDMPVPVWGKAEPGRTVVVEFGEHSANTKVDVTGFWRVDLPPLSVSNQPATLHVSAVAKAEELIDSTQAPQDTPTLVFTDVLVGDVWHCSGQSNMGWPMQRSDNAEAEIAAADYPLIRHFTAPREVSDTPLFTNGGDWQAVSPDTIVWYPAVAYYFGRKVHQSQGVPIGLISTAWGGAAAEAFTTIPTIESSPLTAPYIEQFAAREPDKQIDQHAPAKIYNGLIHPIAPFAHRGVIWYQGENNAVRGPAYRTLLPLMIEDWRTLWNQPNHAHDTPFLIVQLASFKEPDQTPPATNNWAELRDSQAAVAANVKNAYITTAIDIGQADDIHPTNKQDVGLRLARLAEHHVYGDESVVPVGPTLREVRHTDDGSRNPVVVFDHAEGLTTTDGEAPRGFAIRPAGGDGPWVWADATLSGQRVTLAHPDGSQGPFEVRYAYGINPADGPHGINLVNGEGLPAMPFRTDPVPAAE